VCGRRACLSRPGRARSLGRSSGQSLSAGNESSPLALIIVPRTLKVHAQTIAKFLDRSRFRGSAVAGHRHRLGLVEVIKHFHLWIVQGSNREDLGGPWSGETVADALSFCLSTRGQTIKQMADRLGLSEDRFISDYIEATEI